VFREFEPYFYLMPQTEDLQAAKAASEAIAADNRGRKVKAKHVEVVEKKLGGQDIKLLRIVCHSPGDVPSLREANKPLGTVYEHDIPFNRRFVIDSGLIPTALADWEIEGKRVKGFKLLTEGEALSATPQMRSLAFDIETHNPKGIPDPTRDASIMVSFSAGTQKTSGVITYAKSSFGKDFVTLVPSEKEMLEEFCKRVKAARPDIICGYNSDEFDIPYLMERALRTKAAFNLSRGKNARIVLKKLGIRRRAKIRGRIHLDLFVPASLFDFTGTFKFDRLTLGVVYETLTGDHKLDTKKMEIWKVWDEGGKPLEHLLDYSLADALACRKVLDHFLPLEIGLARVTRMNLFDISRATPGQMVENIIMRRAFERNELVPNKPSFAAIESRQNDAIKGAYVKIPSPGIYENIAVFDFRSLYPSIITSFNIDPFTLNCKCCTDKEAHLSPTGVHFCAKQKGVVPETLDRVLDERAKLKAQLKEVAKGSNEYKTLDARQWGLKILANSTYGYLVYARSRYYSRECGEAITALARHYIQQTMKEAEDEGFKVLYGDTDSLFLQLGSKTQADAQEFRKKVNKSLPGRMELELEDFYPRGIFVSKKAAEQGARKKYALISQTGSIKIRGFELVRRDWSEVARNTQRSVLEILLKEGDLPKAVALVRKTVEELMEGKTPLSQCIIRTQLRKNVSSYEVKSPELAAVISARKQGVNVSEHSLVEYVITRQGRTTSEKAQIAELAKDYDADYYVNHQVLPAVLKILGELGFSEDDIKTKGSQRSLSDW
jgi:DNA polymerase elongation subunit (family B)